MYIDPIKQPERFRLHNQEGDAKMNTFNKTILIGRVAEKPELTQLKGNVRASFRIKNSTIQDGREIAQYHKLLAFGNAARACAENLGPGALVCVEGRSHIEGNETADSIIAERITFLSKSKPEEQSKC